MSDKRMKTLVQDLALAMAVVALMLMLMGLAVGDMQVHWDP
jgi:hypothetical protein